MNDDEIFRIPIVSFVAILPVAVSHRIRVARNSTRPATKGLFLLISFRLLEGKWMTGLVAS
jgi:hypothetical protein